MHAEAGATIVGAHGQRRELLAKGHEDARQQTGVAPERWKFVKFLGSKAAADIHARTGTVIPAYRGEESAYARSIPQFNLQAIIGQLPNARTFPSSVHTSVWNDNALKVFADPWSGKEAVPQAAKKMSTQMNSVLANEPH
ncbi:MAG TPA: hypothetical protein VHX59_20115 [Mycobacteriales bacterium]|nr:hypothetical protein [Mycobacteriales bacterium]